VDYGEFTFAHRKTIRISFLNKELDADVDVDVDVDEDVDVDVDPPSFLV